MARCCCCVPGCYLSTPNNGRQRFSKEIKLYNLPRNAARAKLWMDAIPRDWDNPNVRRPKPKNIYVCSLHFVGRIKSNDPQAVDYVPSIFPTVEEKTPVTMENSMDDPDLLQSDQQLEPEGAIAVAPTPELRQPRLTCTKPRNIQCCVDGCGNNSWKDKEAEEKRIYYKVPRDHEQLKAWAAVVPCRTGLTDHHRVCQDHFLGATAGKHGTASFMPTIFSKPSPKTRIQAKQRYKEQEARKRKKANEPSQQPKKKRCEKNPPENFANNSSVNSGSGLANLSCWLCGSPMKDHGFKVDEPVVKVISCWLSDMGDMDTQAKKARNQGWCDFCHSKAALISQLLLSLQKHLLTSQQIDSLQAQDTRKEDFPLEEVAPNKESALYSGNLLNSNTPMNKDFVKDDSRLNRDTCTTHKSVGQGSSGTPQVKNCKQNMDDAKTKQGSDKVRRVFVTKKQTMVLKKMPPLTETTPSLHSTQSGSDVNTLAAVQASESTTGSSQPGSSSQTQHVLGPRDTAKAVSILSSSGQPKKVLVVPQPLILKVSSTASPSTNISKAQILSGKTKSSTNLPVTPSILQSRTSYMIPNVGNISPGTSCKDPKPQMWARQSFLVKPVIKSSSASASLSVLEHLAHAHVPSTDHCRTDGSPDSVTSYSEGSISSRPSQDCTVPPAGDCARVEPLFPNLSHIVKSEHQ